MGRPVQQVQKNHTPSGKDLVTNIDYDYCGRVSKEWLPTPVENSQEYIKPGNFATLSKAYYQDGRPYKENLYSSRYRYDYLEGIQVPGDDMDKTVLKMPDTILQKHSNVFSQPMKMEKNPKYSKIKTDASSCRHPEGM